MRLTTEKVLAKAKKGFQQRDDNRDLFEDVYEYFLPYRNTFSQKGGTLNRPSVQYDSTGAQSASNFVNTMQSNFTPVFSQWAKLQSGPGIGENKRGQVNEQLERLTDTIFAYLDASNFSTAISEMYFDYGIGTGNIWLHEGDENQPLNFIATPMAEMGLTEGRFGTVDGRFRQHKLKAHLIKSTWPNDKIVLDNDLSDIIKHNPDQEITLIEACYYDYDDFIWRYDVIYEPSKHRVIEKEFTEEICFTPRWMKVPGQAFGVGPFIMALADVKTLNKMIEYMLRNAALSVFGVYTVAGTGGFNPNTARIQPNAFIPVERNGGPNGPTIQPLERAGSFDVQEFMVSSLRESIRKTLLDTKLPEQQPQPQTAFEIAQRIREFQQDIGSAYGRAMFEFVQPMFKRIVAILNRKRLIELPEGFQIDNFFVQVNVVSPVAQTQAVDEVQKFMQAFQMTAGISQEIAMAAFDISRVPQFLTEKLGSPSELLKDMSPEELEAKMQEMAQMAMQAQMMQQQGQQPQAQ